MSATKKAAAVVAQASKVLKLNERVHLTDVGPTDHATTELLVNVLSRVGLTLEVGTSPVYRHVALFAARRTRQATTVKL